MEPIGKELKQLQDFWQIDASRWWQLVHRAIPEVLIEQALAETGKREIRRRKLTAKTMLLFAIALGLFTEECSEQVFAAMSEGLRFLDPSLAGQEPKKGGFAWPATGWAPAPWLPCSAASVARWPRRIRQAHSCSACA